VKIFIYNPNSRGGNYEYAIQLAKAYGESPIVEDIFLLLPKNSKLESPVANKILASDIPKWRNKIFSRSYFIYRSFINPWKLFFFLLHHRDGKVIFNDYDQVTSVFWAPVFRLIKRRFVFSVILHDPDRDLYFRQKAISEMTMKKVMSIMDIGFFHERIPARPYYAGNHVKYVDVPHGVFEWESGGEDEKFKQMIADFKEGDLLIAALGNIRTEKNYRMIIESLDSLKDVKLIIGGLPANSSININEYRDLVKNLHLSQRVLIIEKYLTVSEMTTIARLSDAFALYYSNTFKSQSGLLNFFVQFEKPFLVSDNESPLSTLVKKFKLGLIAAPDSSEELKGMLKKFKEEDLPSADWNGYRLHASWNRHVSIALNAFNQVNSDQG
jgi:glycosyltransferase involved in cell wall biosynthesis